MSFNRNNVEPVFTEFQSPLPPQKRAPIIRRKSLWKKLLHIPGDLYLNLMERYEMIEWQRYHHSSSWFLGLALNLLFFCIQSWNYPPLELPSHYPLLSTRSPFGSFDSIKQMDQPFLLPPLFDSLHFYQFEFHPWSFFLQLILTVMSIFNAMYFFKKTKIYHFFETDPKHLPKSKNIRKVVLNEFTPNWAQRFPGNLLWSHFITPWTEDNTNPGQSFKKTAFELSIWDISIFHRNLFCLFSPLQVFIYLCFNLDFYTLILLFLLPTILLFIFDQFQVLVDDKQLIHSHVLHEYNVKFVHPRIYYQRQDVGTSMDQFMISETSKFTTQETNSNSSFLKKYPPNGNETVNHQNVTNENKILISNPFQTARKRLFT